VLAFDKTGTLTRGEPDVIEVVSVDGRNDEDLLRNAAALGDRRGHTFLAGRSLVTRERVDSMSPAPTSIPPARVSEPPWSWATLSTTCEAIAFSTNSDFAHPSSYQLGPRRGRRGHRHGGFGSSRSHRILRLADQPRLEAAAFLAELSGLGVSTVMLTGDNTSMDAAVAGQLGMAAHGSNVLRADKVRAVAELDAAVGTTGMVSNGVSDATVLVAARMSIALGGISSDAAIELADIVLTANEFSALPSVVRHSRKTLARSRENISLALVAKVVVLAIFGVANLWMTIGADVGTSLLVNLNALRPLRD
jgi:Cd2+/Zn2+-exporting ATPase